jgi:hypothetical protein
MTKSDYQRGYEDGVKETETALLSFVAVWADHYQRTHELNGLHPVHFDLLAKHGARMNDFKRATNVEGYDSTHPAAL